MLMEVNKFINYSLTMNEEQSIYDKSSVKTSTKKHSRKSIPKSLKDQLWDTTHGHKAGEAPCYVCGVSINAKRFEAGHVIAVANGGETTLKNLRCICSTCNKSMGSQNLYDFKNKYFSEEPVKICPPVIKYEAIKCQLCECDIKDEKKDVYCKYNHQNVHYHEDCWKQYMKIALIKFGRRTLFTRDTDCIHCLNKNWDIINKL